MVFKVFLDANVILDFTLKREDHEVSRQIFELAVAGDIEAYTTPAVIHITAYYLARFYGRQKARELILALLSDVKVIDADHEITVAAVHSRIDDVEDAILYYTALHHKLYYFLSSDKALKKQGMPALQVYTPADFLREAYFAGKQGTKD